MRNGKPREKLDESPGFGAVLSDFYTHLPPPTPARLP